jgi:hypothetical protein
MPYSACQMGQTVSYCFQLLTCAGCAASPSVGAKRGTHATAVPRLPHGRALGGRTGAAADPHRLLQLQPPQLALLGVRLPTSLHETHTHARVQRLPMRAGAAALLEDSQAGRWTDGQRHGDAHT